MSSLLTRRNVPRLARGLHQRAYARALGVSLQDVVAWEDGADVGAEAGRMLVAQEMLHGASTDLRVYFQGEKPTVVSAETTFLFDVEAPYQILVGVGIVSSRGNDDSPKFMLKSIDDDFGKSIFRGPLNSSALKGGVFEGRCFLWLCPTPRESFRVTIAPLPSRLALKALPYIVCAANKEWYE